MIISTFFDVATLHVAWQCQVTAVSVLKSMVFCMGKTKKTLEPTRLDIGMMVTVFFLSARIANVHGERTWS